MGRWKEVSLESLCDLEKGKTGLMKAIPGKYPLVATGKDRRTCDSYQFDTKAVCIPLVSSTGHGHASLKYVHYQEGKFALGTILVAVIPKDENVLNAQFLHLYLSRLKDEILVPLMTGAANVTLTVTKLKTVKVPLPPIEEQLRIVSLFNRMDNEQAELTDEISNQQDLLKKLRQSILQEAIEGKLTASWREQNPDVESASVLLEKIKAEKEHLIKEKKIKKQKPLPSINEDEIPFDIPDGWEWCKLGDIANLITKGSSPKWQGVNYTDESKGILFITSENVGNNTLITKNKKYVEKKFNEIEPRSILEKGDILTNIVGASIGRTAIYNIDDIANINQAVCLVRLENTELNKEYIVYFLNSNAGIEYMLAKQFSPGRANLSLSNMSNMIIPFPPSKEQEIILKKIENLFKIYDELETQIDSSKVNSEMLMQAVLKEAFEK